MKKPAGQDPKFKEGEKPQPSLFCDITDVIKSPCCTIRDLSELEELRRQINRAFTHEDIIGQHPRMREILSLLPDIAESESPVLVQGPTGSGKELIARALHNLSPRKDGPFIVVNCAALP